MTIIRVQATFERSSGLPKDRIVNTMHWDADGNTGVQTDDQVIDGFWPGLVNRYAAFYGAFDQYMPANNLQGGMTLKAYRMADPLPRVPVKSEFVPLTFVGSSMPGEVAVCLSFAAESVAGQSQVRRRGRIFIGPLNTVAAESNNPVGDARVTTGLLNAISGAFQAFAVSATPGSFRLAVYSPTDDTSGKSLADSTNDVKTWFIDNAFDTIRKRGVAPTARVGGTLTG